MPTTENASAGGTAVRDIPIDWEALEDAFENNAPEVHSYLHLGTGDVLRVVDGVADPQMHARIAADTNYLRIDPVSSREQYRWMERFVGSVADEALRERLIISIDGKGAFRRFKDVLLAYPAERERWFSYRAELLHWHIQQWLEQHDIHATNEPPWGKVDAPSELPTVGRPVVHGTEAPGEALRRQVRDLIETIPAIELPTAIAFLEFLKQRSAEALAKEHRDAEANDEARDRDKSRDLS
jgi:uncharacterized protein UPF0158